MAHIHFTLKLHPFPLFKALSYLEREHGNFIRFIISVNNAHKEILDCSYKQLVYMKLFPFKNTSPYSS